MCKTISHASFFTWSLPCLAPSWHTPHHAPTTSATCLRRAISGLIAPYSPTFQAVKSRQNGLSCTHEISKRHGNSSLTKLQRPAPTLVTSCTPASISTRTSHLHSRQTYRTLDKLNSSLCTRRPSLACLYLARGTHASRRLTTNVKLLATKVVEEQIRMGGLAFFSWEQRGRETVFS